MLPWTLPDEDGVSGKFGDCQACQRWNPPGTGVRERWHCGYLPRSAWLGERPEVGRIGPEPYDADVCPGYLVTQPAVSEAARALFWAEKGELGVVYPSGVPAALLEACEALARAQNLHHVERLQAARRKS